MSVISGSPIEGTDVDVLLGTGTFGRVVLVKDKGSSDYMALKVMNIGEVVRLKQVQHVQNEKSILMSIDHPFIVGM